jgi:hypothetical protein
MYDKADLVVIAKPLFSKDTQERTMLPGWDYVHVVGVNTAADMYLQAGRLTRLHFPSSN